MNKKNVLKIYLSIMFVANFFLITIVMAPPTNRPPLQSNPNPDNSAIKIPLSITQLNVTIEDPEGDNISWTIETSPNIGKGSGIGETNGSKYISISDLTYETTYTWYVNATDLFGSGKTTTESYTFTTIDNLSPVISDPNPEDGAIGVPISITQLNVTIEDPEGDNMNWTIETSPNIGKGSGIGEANGSKYISISGLTYETTYTWYVNASDSGGGGETTHAIYRFTTLPNLPPNISNPNPLNGTDVSKSISQLCVTIEDPDWDFINWTIETSPNIGNGSGIGEANGTKCCPISGLTYNTTYIWYVNATDPGGRGETTYTFYTFTITDNLPPVISNPSPSNGKTGVSISAKLSWSCSDPDGDDLTYDGYFGTSNNPPLVFSGLSQLYYDPPGTMSYDTHYYWKIVAEDEFGANTTGTIWSFTTNSEGSTPQPPVNPPIEPKNKNPVANSSAGKPYQGIVGSDILFDGSLSYDPDGNITKWFWEFGDNTNATGVKVNHKFSKAGKYSVYLTVTDNEGATNIDYSCTCMITLIKVNKPPMKPSLSGTITGSTNTEYSYTVVSTDPNNDLIKYIFNWSGSGSQSSQFLPSGTRFNVNHSWTTPGQYILTVTVTDNQFESSSNLTININTREKVSQTTPGFEFILIILAITLIIIFKRKRKNNE